MASLKCRPGGIDDKRPQAEENEQRLCPPDIGTHRLTERGPRQFGCGVGHERVLIMTRGGLFKQIRRFADQARN